MKIYKTRKDVITSLIQPTDSALDVGFWGQATKPDDPDWLHGVLKKTAQEVYGLDLEYDASFLGNAENYKHANAEHFDFDVSFDVIYASELIEHLSNPGLFLDSCKRNLKKGGRLIITTPNAYNFFSLVEKVFKREPSVNSDHTLYFNHVVLRKLLEKNGWVVSEQAYVDSYHARDRQSLKRKILYVFYRTVSVFTDKYSETLLVVAQPQ